MKKEYLDLLFEICYFDYQDVMSKSTFYNDEDIIGGEEDFTGGEW